MDKKEKEYYLKILLKEKNTILKNLGYLKEGIESVEKGVPTHIGDLGTDEFVRGLGIDISHSEEQILRQIDEAIEKLEKGKYGICENCGKKIPKNRLKVIPYAKYCVKCKKEMEKSE
ncbi:MAG TPA: TraR/DksA C4-type zinc finger protein [bacterium]|nr:TraR/DksA C4-type zinc finger protein [bacterium]